MALDWSWTFAPVPIAAVLGYGTVYGLRFRAVRASREAARGAPAWRAAAFATGLLLVLVALTSPLDRLGEQLASAHMVQHLLLADLVPIALIAGTTRVLLRPVTRAVHRLERAAGPLAHPVFGVVAYVGVMWCWHVPALYDAAVRHELVHVLEHLTFAAAGFLYWWHLLSPIRSRLRLGGLGPVGYMASTKVLVGFLGIGLTFSPTLLYDVYAGGGGLGMSPLDDLHVAGAFMALEQAIVMGIALAVLFARALAESEREQQRREALEDTAV